MQSAVLLRLLQLASPSLPIGAYTYSQGLEAAIEAGLVRDEASARGWITASVGIIANFEAPILCRLLKAFSARDLEAVTQWTGRLVAARDTVEFRAESLQMGFSLGKLIMDLGILDEGLHAMLAGQQEVPLPTAFACAAEALAVPHEMALLGMLFSTVENQVLTCVKSVPLGQLSGQRLLLSLHDPIESAAAHARRLGDDELSNWAPRLSLLSMRHETQYSRIYRS